MYRKSTPTANARFGYRTIVVDAYKVDPREAGNGGAKPEVSFLLRIRHYGNWDITQEEYDELIFIIPDISGRNASEYTTIELVIE